MSATAPERYAVVSCHVERPLDDGVWTRFSALQGSQPGGFAIAALMRPADPAFGEDEAVWVERAREAAARGPLGHHTHWTAPDHARPLARTPESLVTLCHEGTADRVQQEAQGFRHAGLAPTLFCGGGWYTDREVAEACAEIGYVDCTPRAKRPAYLPPEAPWATLERAAIVELPSGAELRAIPTTHSLGDLLRALPSRRLPELVHVYFHDTDLLDARRRALLRVALPLLARRAHATDLDALAGRVFPGAPGVPWDDVARN